MSCHDENFHENFETWASCMQVLLVWKWMKQHSVSSVAPPLGLSSFVILCAFGRLRTFFAFRYISFNISCFSSSDYGVCSRSL